MSVPNRSCGYVHGRSLNECMSVILLEDMDCKYQGGDFLRKSDQNGTLRVLRSKRKHEPCAKLKECRKEQDVVTLLPSDYMKQISTSPENILRVNPGFNELDSPIFTASPRIVVFRDFSIGKVYVVTFCIQNISQIPQQLRLVRSEDVSFNVVFKGSTLNTRLAPGMTHTYDIEFHPDEMRDYYHDVVFDTDLKSFIVPVIAVGPRAILSFPDQIDVGKTAVRVVRTTPVLMQNIGDALTGFTFTTNNSSFSVIPSKGSIEIGEAIQIQISFTPSKTGFSNGWIHLRYESGDIVQSMTYGEGVECDVRLLESTISFENTYLGLSRISSIEIQNHSNYTLAFKCLKFKDIETDLREKETRKRAIDMTRSSPMGDSVPQNDLDVISQRIYSDEVELIMEQSLFYESDHFQLFPETGEVWPQSTTKISVTFQPKEVGEISSVVFLEISGQERRLPVSLSGECLGPALELNVLSLDIQEIYLCSTYEYEIVCKNSGPVPGTLAFMPKDSNFGTTISAEPSEIALDIDKVKPIKLIVCSYRNGTFIERADFVIKESSEIISIVLKGNAICPLICVDNDIINFHTVSLGFTQKKEWRFRNLSHEPIDFEITVPSDGHENAITHEKFAKAQMLLRLPVYPHEFRASPNDGTVKAGKVMSIKVSYTPNIERAGSVPLQIHLRKSLKAEPLMVPIKFDAKKASFAVDHEKIFIRFCFVNFPYCRDLIVTNQSEVDGYFHIESQEVFRDSKLLCSLSSDEGYLKAGQSTKICLKLIVMELGEHTTTLQLQSIGFEEPIPFCQITCIGEGPVVSVDPPFLDLGEVNLIETKICTFTLRNDSPIPAEFSLSVNKNPSNWRCEPNCGELDVDESVEIQVTVFLRDSGKYTDHISVFIANGRTISVNISATGVGSSIVFSPQILPVFEMGVLLSRQDVTIPITLKNEGTRHHRISLTTDSKPRQAKKAVLGDVEKKIFKVEPDEIDLPPGMSQTIQCQIRWNTIEAVTELWSIFATIENQTKSELLGKSTFTATFTEPLITFDKSEFTFRLDFGCDYENVQQEDRVVVSNQTGCDMNAHVTADPPFLLINECNCLTDEMDTCFMNGETFTMKVHFPFEAAHSDMTPQKYEGFVKIEYKEHKHIDSIPCRAEVNFPYLIFVPKDVNIFCEFGKKTQEKMRLINDGPLKVNYRIKLIRETLSICRLDTSDEGESESTETDPNFVNEVSPSNQSFLNGLDPTQAQIEKDENTYFCDNFSDGFLAIQFTDCESGSEECSNYSKDSGDFLDKYLKYQPEGGQIDPHQEQDVSFSFNGYERVKLSVQAICDIEGARSHAFNIIAIADIIRCEVDDGPLDFGFNYIQRLTDSNSRPTIWRMLHMRHVTQKCFQDVFISKHIFPTLEFVLNRTYCDVTSDIDDRGWKYFGKKIASEPRDTCAPPPYRGANSNLHLYFEPAMTSLRIVNHCKIPLEWDIEMTSNVLRVVDGPEFLKPESESTISIERRPSAPGTFSAKLYLKVSYLEPFVIDVNWTATMPQIYLADVPRDERYAKFSIKNGYDAVGVLISELTILENDLADTRCSSMDVEHEETQITEFELSQLLDNGWELINENEEIPKQSDIDMALERMIVRSYIKTTDNDEVAYHFDDDNREISSLLVPGYSINMGSVLVEQMSQLHISLKNHGYERARLKLRKFDVRRKSPSSCFNVLLERNTEDCSCENNYVIVSFSPRAELFSQKRTEVSYKFNLEVKCGLTIPVSVTALAVYPEITVEPQILNFENVYVGQCREMSFLLKNEGLVDCKWNIEIHSKSQDPTKCTDDPFYVHYTQDLFVTGQRAIIKVYFKPNKIGEQRRNLALTIPLTRDPIIVALVGNGTKHKVKISETKIEFAPMVPSTDVAAKIINIENLNPYPIEVYWKNLSDFSEVNRITRILKHYYRSKTILIPQREIGEDVPVEIHNFYTHLLLQMCADSDFKSIIDSIIKDSVGDESSRDDIPDSPSSDSFVSKKVKEKKSKFEIKKSKRKSQSKVEQPHGLPSHLWAMDPGEIENLLHAFIDKLQEDENFSATMKDPVSELYLRDEYKRENPEPILEKFKRVIVIFHGAPFTEYQETACKCARSLNLPVLSLNQVFLESIAYSTTPSASKLAEQIDNRYKELVTRFQKFVASNSVAVSRSSQSSDSGKIIRVASKIPPPDEFDMMDKYSSYECKIEVVEAILDLMESTDLFGSSQIKDRSSVKSQDIYGRKQSLLPSANLDHLREILQTGLSHPKFDDGYILQSLSNNFVKSDTTAMRILLEATGKVENYLFITFHNSFELFEKRMQNLNSLRERNQSDECSENVDSEKTPSDTTTVPENDELLLDGPNLKKRVSANLSNKSRSEDDLRRVSKIFDGPKKKGRKSSGFDKMENMSVKSMKEFHCRGDYNGLRIEENVPEVEDSEEIQNRMAIYENNLEKLMDIISEWESGKLLETSRSVKNFKGRKKSLGKTNSAILARKIYRERITESDEHHSYSWRYNDDFKYKSTDKFFMWFIKATDPWDEQMYHSVVETLSSQLAGSLAKGCCKNEQEPQLPESRSFSILEEYDTPPASFISSEIFSISPVVDSSQSVSDEACELNPENESPVLYNQISERWTLLPYESRRFEIKFAPQEEGVFKSEFKLGLIDNASANLKIRVEGVAAIPYVNFAPHSVFDRVRETKMSPYHDPTYFLDTSTYDFGSLLFLKKQGRYHKKHTLFRFKNMSPVWARLTFDLATKRFEDFSIDASEVVIEPNGSSTIDVTACATGIGSAVDNLIVKIEHNEKQEKIQMRYTSSELNFECEPKQCHIGRMLINSKEDQIITLRNNSPVPVYWRLSTEITESEVKLRPSQGKLKHNSSYEVNLQFFAVELYAMKTRILNLEVFLEETDAQPIFSDIISIHAEVYEINVVVDAKNPIDLQTLPVDSTSAESFIIKNMGPHEVNFEVEYEELEKMSRSIDTGTLATLRRDLTVFPMNGVVPSKKQVVVNIHYTPSVEVVVNNLPLLTCIIGEPHKNVGEISKHSLFVSVVSYYTRYTICPFPTLNFGAVALKLTKTMQLMVENTGKFPLKYKLVNPSTQQLIKTNSREKQKKKEKTAGQSNPNRDRNSINSASEKWGPFSMEKTSGELDPNEKDILTVDCCSHSIGRFKEILCVMVPYSSSTEKSDTLSLVAEIVVADVQFENYEEMFIDSYVVNSIEELECSKMLDEFTVFSRETKTLHYRGVCVGNSLMTTIALLNTSAVSGDISVKVAQESLSPEIFRIDRDILNIPAMSKSTFNVTFEPTSIGVFSATLEMKLNLPDNSEQFHSISLEGEGCIPLIRVLNLNKSESEDRVIDFGLSLVSQRLERTLEVHNIGQVVANITVEVSNDPDETFSVLEERKSDSPPCRGVTEKGTSQLTLRIIPNDFVILKIQFTPLLVRKFESKLTILLDKNPYENVEITLVGEGFTRPVIFDTLEIAEPPTPVTNKRSRESSSKGQIQQISQPAPVVYKLVYGRCFLNRVYRMSFRIFNKTTDRCFRFEWNPHPNFVCTPLAGHLTPDSFKALTAMFLASEPTSLNQESVNCAIEEIVLKDSPSKPSWDSRLTRVSWVEKYPSSFELATEAESFCDEEVFIRKSEEESVEPEFEVVPGSTQLMQLLISAVANYSDYECPIDTINFPDTLMFQTSQYHFRVENTSTVNLDFLWDLTMNEQYPVRLDHSSTLSEENRESNLSLNLRERKKNRLSVRIQTPGPVPDEKRGDFKSSSTKQSYEESDLFSSSAGMTNRSTDSWIESENWPFQINPVSGSLAPDESMEFTVKFMPLDVFEYKANLCCKMENLDPERHPLQIAISAKSLLPYCHFDIANSNYLSSGRRDDALPGPPGYSLADPETRDITRVVEFRLIGAAQCHTRHIDLLNPTSEDYSYSCVKLSNVFVESLSGIQCSPESGVAEKGRRTRIIFTIIPEKTGTFESFWQFEIKKYELKTLFLIVSHVVEPSISCRNTMLKLEASTVGQIRRCCVEISNHESCPLLFQIKPDSLYSEGRLQAICVSPMHGTLQSNSTQIFNVEYNPTLVGKYTFNILCEIEKLEKPAKVSVMAEVIELSPQVIHVGEDGHETKLSANSTKVLDIGQLTLNEPTTLEFRIMNMGQIFFDYVWNSSLPDNSSYKISYSDLEGRVEQNSSNICYLKIITTKRVTISNQLVMLKIKYGPTYRIKLNASAKMPPIEFSFSSYDFGPCYLQIQDGVMNSVELEITNHQKTPCMLSCKYNHDSCIRVNLNKISKAIPPQSSVRVSIYFQPRHEVAYSESMMFSAKNNPLKKTITIKGEGIPYKIHLRNPCDSIIDFGMIMLGTSCCRKVKIVNEGRLPVEFQIIITDYSIDDSSVDSRWRNLDSERSNSRKSYSKSNTTSAILSSDLESVSNSLDTSDIEKFFEISPNAVRKLKPDRELEMVLKFKATEPIKSLKVRLGLRTSHSLLPLLTFKGSCIAANFTLNRSYISFGTIYEGGIAKEKVVLVNNGDIRSKFNWEFESAKPHFSIQPLKGFCPAHSEVVFTCTFEPAYQESCIQTAVTLLLKEYSNLSLKITGNCLPLPEASGTVEFVARAPQTQTKNIDIQNDSTRIWFVKPKILGECFTAEENVVIEGKSIKAIDVTYKPCKKLKGNNFDVGKMIIHSPDGKQPLVYNLSGSSNPDIIEERITRRIPAEKKFIETLTVTNRSNYLSIFDCKIEQFQGDAKEETSTFQLKVPPGEDKRHEFPFFFEREGNHHYRVTFDDHRENHQIYDIVFEVTKPDPRALICLTTYVRSAVFHTLRVENLSKSSGSTFKASIDSEDVVIHGLPMYLQPLAFTNVQLDYTPLLPCNTQVTLTVTSDELDKTYYDVQLIAKPAPPAKPVTVKSSLGNFVNFTITLRNHSRESCEFVVTPGEPSFTYQKNPIVPANQETALEIRFTPHNLDTVHSTIKATSTTAGEFVFPVVGKVSPPQPRGPYVISPGTPAIIPFENVFLDKKEFEFVLDSDRFVVHETKANIDSKKTFNICVELKTHRKSMPQAATAKLMVSCTDKQLSHIKWTHYLKAAQRQ